MDATAPEDYALILNNSTVRDNDNTAFNDTAPTSTTFSIGTSATINQNGNIHIAYCFAEKKGYSKFGFIHRKWKYRWTVYLYWV